MSLKAIRPGLKAEVKLVVSREHTARHVGSGSVEVLATPQMILLMEQAAVAAVDPLLPEGYHTVGVHLDVKHLAPTPVGFEVRATAELIQVEGQRLTFSVDAHDGPPGKDSPVGSGVHKRAIVDAQRFGAGVAQKLAQQQAAQ